MLRFDQGDDFIEINVTTQESENLPSHGDAHVTVRISSNGFSGHNDLWVLASQLQSFCQNLVTLKHQRQGEAVLEAISPGELLLAIRSVNSCGHMLVEGSTGFHVFRENSHPWHSVQFGFEFDPSQLSKAIRVSWVRKNAGAIGQPSAIPPLNLPPT